MPVPRTPHPIHLASSLFPYRTPSPHPTHLFSHSEFRRLFLFHSSPPPPRSTCAQPADEAWLAWRSAGQRGEKPAGRVRAGVCARGGGDVCRRVTVREAPSRPTPRRVSVCLARACARGCVRGPGGAPGRATSAAAAAAALGLGGHRPPARLPPPPTPPRPAPAQPPSSVRAAPWLGAKRRRLREPSGARSAPGARTARGRAGDAGPPRARPSPGPGPRGKGLSRPPPPGWRASPRSPSACSCGCSCRRCPAPGHRAPQVSALPAPRSSRDPRARKLCGCGGLGLGGRSPRPCLQTPAVAARRAGGQRARPLASRDRPRGWPSSPLHFPAAPPSTGWSNFPRLLRIFPLAASHLSESVTCAFGAAR